MLFTKRLSRPGGREKVHAQMASILDSSLLARLRAEVTPGDAGDHRGNGLVSGGYSNRGERVLANQGASRPPTS